LEQTGVDPFAEAITLPAACNLVFRRKFLKENTIALIPVQNKENQSKKAIKWIKWIAYSKNVNIRHKLNGKEHKIGKFKVDGYIENTNTILEFYGCLWHGCLQCIKNRKQYIIDNSKNAEEAFLATIDRRKYFENLGYNMLEIWECAFDKEMKNNVEMKTFVANLEISDPINPRDALYGGRTCALKLYHKTKPGEKFFFYDIVSLYPYICKTGIFPIGKPIIYTENFLPLESKPYLGLIKCTILPPQKLLHPVLPFKHEGKLLFSLCRTCAVEKSETCIGHDESARVIIGTFVTEEVYLALEKGYKMLHIDEIWHYKQFAQYKNPKSNLSNGIFTDYINLFLKIKQEASGFPDWVHNDADKTMYINNYFEKEGILLDEEKIEKKSRASSIR